MEWYRVLEYGACLRLALTARAIRSPLVDTEKFHGLSLKARQIKTTPKRQKLGMRAN
jgi:hypothetical protein